jgi:peptidoglycan/LPS O-acetylase OafA/YrhL
MALHDQYLIVNKFLTQKWLIWIGIISYPLYLFHYLALGVFHSFLGNNEYIGINNTFDIIITVLSLAISLLFSWILNTFVEKPILRWGHKYKYQ